MWAPFVFAVKGEYMSVQYFAAVFKQSKSQHTARLVLLALANYADQDGVCWPSWTTLENDCNASRRTIGRAISELQELGELQIQEKAQKGHKTTRYKITIELESKRHRCQNDTTASVKMTPELVSKWHPEPSVEPSIEPSYCCTVAQRDKYPPDTYKAIEDAFSQAYTAKTGREYKHASIPIGRKAIKSLLQSGADPDTIADMAREYVDKADGKYRAYTIQAFVRNYNDIQASAPMTMSEARQQMERTGGPIVRGEYGNIFDEETIDAW